MQSCSKIIEDDWPVKVISGNNFDPSSDAKFKDPVPKTDLYFVFLFYRGSQEDIGEKTINVNTRECLSPHATSIINYFSSESNRRGFPSKLSLFLRPSYIKSFLPQENTEPVFVDTNA